MRIREAEYGDIAALSSLASRTFVEAYDDLSREEAMAYVGEFFSRDRIRTYLEDPAVCILLAETSRLHGYVLLDSSTAPVALSSSSQVQCVRLFVDVASQKKRLGSELLGRAQRHAEQSGFEILWVKVWDQNTRAISFYEKRGFSHFGTVAYTDGGLDDEVLIMACDIGENSQD